MSKHNQSEAGEEKPLNRELLEQYLEELIPDCNLKLLCEGETVPGRLLWVERITVTAYEAAPYSGNPDFYKRRGRRILQRIWDFLKILWQIGQCPYP
ncbi:MAG: hypothetical protein NC094_10130 [Bacteroidales bacterium]|nr:hypothetical protein [Lachnoclostridium sp.]MCM1383277.1 hypothetical protein [Lachnoclostridium sp.]MCM1465765.1 hypothetical protein [Bacteroidales bacterium]